MFEVLKKCRKQKIKNCKEIKWKNNAFIKMCNDDDSKKSKFITQQEAAWLLSSFGIKRLLIKVPLVGPLNSRGINKSIQDIKWTK